MWLVAAVLDNTASLRVPVPLQKVLLDRAALQQGNSHSTVKIALEETKLEARRPVVTVQLACERDWRTGVRPPSVREGAGRPLKVTLRLGDGNGGCSCRAQTRAESKAGLGFCST